LFLILNDRVEAGLILEDGCLVLLNRFLIRLDVTLIGEDDLLIFENLFLVVDDRLFRHFGRQPPAVKLGLRSVRANGDARGAYMVVLSEHFVNDCFTLGRSSAEFVMTVFA
jgi:hypothetical protein